MEFYIIKFIIRNSLESALDFDLGVIINLHVNNKSSTNILSYHNYHFIHDIFTNIISRKRKTSVVYYFDVHL